MRPRGRVRAHEAGRRVLPERAARVRIPDPEGSSPVVRRCVSPNAGWDRRRHRWRWGDRPWWRSRHGRLDRRRYGRGRWWRWRAMRRGHGRRARIVGRAGRVGRGRRFGRRLRRFRLGGHGRSAVRLGLADVPGTWATGVRAFGAPASDPQQAGRRERASALIRPRESGSKHIRLLGALCAYSSRGGVRRETVDRASSGPAIARSGEGPTRTGGASGGISAGWGSSSRAAYRATR